MIQTRTSLYIFIATALFIVYTAPSIADATVTVGNCKIVTVAGGTFVTGIEGSNCSFAELSRYLDPQCKPDGTGCNSEELNVLRHINLACNYNYNQIGCPSGTTDAQKDDLLKLPVDCKISSGNWSAFFSPTCWGRTISVVLGTALITVTAWLLAAAGYLFNTLIDYTIVKFGSTLLDAGVRQAIEVGWTALRDVANIVIIAMFVFIAINIILGVEEYGKKRLIARVLIIAVLINFSLLFTKAIIDASNFTAWQFYKASAIETDATAASTAQEALRGSYAQQGIAGQFIKFMGLASIGDTYKALTSAAFGAESKKFENANGWYALLHGLVSATLLLFAAAALLYGCYFLITRAVLLIFLMMTSALAFAAWLIPQQRIVKGFARWWESLLKAALFGPLLIIFLWASLNVARAINPQGKGTLGDLVRDPSQTLNLEALFAYVIVLGLLFASIYAANTLSKGIAGFSVAGRFWAAPALTAAGLGSRVAGIAGRTAIGGTSNALLAGMRAAGFGGNAVGRAFMRPFDWASRQSFDALRNQTVRKSIEGLGGVVLGGADYGKGGFRALKEQQADELNALSKRLAPGKDDRERMADDAGKAAEAKKEKELSQKGATLAKEKSTADAMLVRKEKEIEDEKKKIAAEHEDEHGATTRGHQEEKARAAREKEATEAVLKTIEQELVRNPGDTGKLAEKNRLEQNIKEQTARIEKADVAIGALTKDLNQKLKATEEKLAPHRETAAEKAAALKKHEDTKEATLKSAYNEGYNKRNIKLQSATIAESMARSKFAFGREEIVRQLGNSKEKDALRQAAITLGQVKEEKKAGVEKPKPPATLPPTPPATGGSAPNK